MPKYCSTRLMYSSRSILEACSGWNWPQWPFWDHFIEGSKKKFLSLQLTYPSNPESDFWILKPPWLTSILWNFTNCLWNNPKDYNNDKIALFPIPSQLQSSNLNTLLPMKAGNTNHISEIKWTEQTDIENFVWKSYNWSRVMELFTASDNQALNSGSFKVASSEA